MNYACGTLMTKIVDEIVKIGANKVFSHKDIHKEITKSFTYELGTIRVYLDKLYNANLINKDHMYYVKYICHDIDILLRTVTTHSLTDIKNKNIIKNRLDKERTKNIFNDIFNIAYKQFKGRKFNSFGVGYFYHEFKEKFSITFLEIFLNRLYRLELINKKRGAYHTWYCFNNFDKLEEFIKNKSYEEIMFNLVIELKEEIIPSPNTHKEIIEELEKSKKHIAWITDEYIPVIEKENKERLIKIKNLEELIEKINYDKAGYCATIESKDRCLDNQNKKIKELEDKIKELNEESSDLYRQLNEVMVELRKAKTIYTSRSTVI